MERYIAKEIVKKILNRDYERWIRYKDTDVGKSFYCWKEEQGLIEKDAEDIAEILCD